MSKQTWWDKEIKNQFQDFKSWVGPSTAYSKVAIRQYIADNREYSSVLDFGCGMCDDYFTYKDTMPLIKWEGLDSSDFLYGKAIEKGIPVIHAEAHNSGLEDNYVDVAYSRHVLEHQKSYKPILSEMIRVAKKAVIHIFFIVPKENEIINYTPENNLYHNTFNRAELEAWVKENDKVKDIEWVKVRTDFEEALVIHLK